MSEVNKKAKKRVLGREVSKELSLEEMSELSGGWEWPWCETNPVRDDRIR